MISAEPITNSDDENEKLEEIFQQVNSRQKKQKQQKKEEEMTSCEYVDSLLKTAKLQIIGYTPEHEVIFWQKGRKRLFSARQMSKHDLVLLLGRFEGKHDEIKDHIIEEAWRKGIVDLETPLKLGVWRTKGGWLLNTGKSALSITDSGISDLNEPVYDGQLIEFNKKEWLDIEEFKRAYADPNLSLSSVFIEIDEYVSQWNWLASSMGKYATALIMLSVVQHALPWRPWIFILGPKGSGKTSFFERILGGIYPDLSVRLDKVSAHALAQNVGNSGVIPILDEQDKNPKIDEVLELSKSFCRGGKKSSGTTSSKAREYSLHHLAWFGAIYYSATILQDAAKQSRIIKLELIAAKTRGVLRQPEKDGKLIARILAALFREWQAIEERAEEIYEARANEGAIQADDRTYENFMYASAILSFVYGAKYTIPEWTIASIETDEQHILMAILSSIVDASLGGMREKRSVAELIGQIKNGPFAHDAKDSLGRLGIAIVQPRNDADPYLALDAEAIRRHVLKDTSYSGADVGGVLKRIEGAKTSTQKIGGKAKKNAILIPCDVLDKLLGNDSGGDEVVDE
jgi:hypothetical protein